MKKLKLEELGRITVSEFKNIEKLPVCIVLDNVRSLHNVGSAFRTADAFRMEKIFLTGITGTPPHREIHKTALGSTESVAWEYAEKTESIISRLKDEGNKIIVVEQTNESISLQNFQLSLDEKYAFVFGNEVNGVNEEAIALANAAIEIPQSGTKHSLNISVCLGIVMWEVAKQFGF
jgi:tRNA G18 (ribose-2'-O)-methylase SpoU